MASVLARIFLVSAKAAASVPPRYSTAAQCSAHGGDEVGQHRHPGGKRLLGLRVKGMCALSNEPRLRARNIAGG
jgi:hypothetical protein